MSRPTTGLYAYAITPTATVDLTGVVGLAGAAADVIAHDRVGLVVSDIELSLLDEVMTEEPTEDGRLAVLAREHDAVVRAAFEQVAVLPLRFGTVVPDHTAARRLLADRHDKALAVLNRVAGHQEWGVKVCGVARQPERVTPRVNDAKPSGTEYLARRRTVLAEAERREDHRRQVLDDVTAELAEHAADRVSRRMSGGDVVLDVAYLVPESEIAGFLVATEGSADRLSEHDLRLEITGPWPPYSFARTDFTELSDA